MATNTWQGVGNTGTGIWSTATNWSQGVVGDTKGYDVLINGGANISGSGTLATNTVTFGGSGTVTFTGTFTFTTSTSFTIDAGVTLVMPSTATVNLNADIAMSGAGTATLSGGTYTSNDSIDVGTGQTLVLTGGAKVTDGSTTGSGTITLNGASLTLSSTGAPSATINFATVTSGPANSLTLPTYTVYGAGPTITGFGYGDSISLGGAALTLIATGSSSGGYSVYNISDGTHTFGSVTLAAGTPGATGAASGSTITLHNSGGSNTYPCFYPGTMLATEDGEVAVEDVTIGMMLKTLSGELVPVRWVGWSQVSTVFADPLRVLPIRIQAGALAEGVPARDLLVSPDHALLLDGVLVQAGALVNGTSIFREENVPESFRYYHVELATHELLLAEGCPAESFVDNVDRMNFHNWDARETPHTPVLEMELPRAKSARQVPASILGAIAARAVRFAASKAA